jgi:hypothetical protein
LSYLFLAGGPGGLIASTGPQLFIRQRSLNL